MKDLLWLIPAFPLMGSLFLILMSGHIKKPLAGIVGSCAIGLSATLALVIGFDFVSSGEQAYHQILWSWWDVSTLNPAVGLYLDRLAAVFVFVITFVGFLIHVYSMGYMAHDEGYT